MARILLDTRQPGLTTEAPGKYINPNAAPGAIVGNAVNDFAKTVDEFSQRYARWQDHIAYTKGLTQLEAQAQDLKTGLDETPNPQTAWPEYKQAFSQAKENALKGQSAVVAEQLSQAYDRYGIGLESYAQARIYKHTKEQAVQSENDAVMIGAQSVYKDAAGLDNAMQTVEQTIQGNTGTLWSNAQAEQRIQDAQANLVNSAISGQLANQNWGGARSLIDKYGDKLTPSQREALTFRTQSLELHENDIHKEQANALSLGVFDSILKTGNADPGAISHINQLLSDPLLKQYRQYANAAIQQARDIHVLQAGWSEKTNQAITSELASLPVPAMGDRYGNALHNMALRSAAKLFKLRADDPAQAAVNAGHTSPQAIEDYEHSIGLKYAPMTNAQTAEIGHEWAGASTESAKIAILEQVQSQFATQQDPNGIRAAHQLAASLKQSDAMLLLPHVDQDAAHSYLQMMNFPKDKQGEIAQQMYPDMTTPSKATLKLKSDVQTQGEPYLRAMKGVDPNTYAMYDEFVTKAALGYAAQGVSNPINKAWHDVFAGQKVRNGTLMPEGANADDVTWNLDQAKKNIDPRTLYSGPGMTQQEYFAATKPQLHWVLDTTSPANPHYFLTGSLGPVYKKGPDGKPVPYTLSIKDALSPLNHEQMIQREKDKGLEKQLEEQGFLHTAGIH